MLKSSFFDYSDAYIFVSETVLVENTSAAGAAANNTNKKAIFKNCAPFIDCVSEINNTKVDKTKDIDIVMPMYNLIEYSKFISYSNYFKTSGSLWQCYRDEPSIGANNAIVDFTSANHGSKQFKYQEKVTGQTRATMAEKVLK